MSIITLSRSPVASPGSLFFQLVSGQFQPNKLWQSRRFRIKFLLRSLLFPVTTSRYLQQIATLPAMRQSLMTRGLLPAKIHRPYLCAGFSVKARAQALIDHYRFIQNQSDSGLYQLLQSPIEKVLAAFDGKDGESFVISYSPGYFDREGEVTLVLRYNNIVIAMLSFTIIQRNNNATILIGGLQGPHKNISSDVIRHATKACYGLFPKRLLMETLFILAAECTIKHIIAVGDSQHVFHRWRYRHSKKSVFIACYSEFWTSLNGVADNQGLYTLPLTLPRKAPEEIASKKRAEYRRRYALMDNVQGLVQQTIHPH